MTVYFASTFFQIFREGPPAKRAVRAPGIDTKKEIPGIRISIKPVTKTGAISSNIQNFYRAETE